MSEQTRREEITSALVNICRAAFPLVTWGTSFTGAKRGGLSGTVTCDKIEFDVDEKGGYEGRADYSIYILDMAHAEAVDVIADGLFDVLTLNETLNGAATDLVITSIRYGAPQGNSQAGIACIDLKVTFNI